MALRERVLTDGYARLVRPRLFRIGDGDPEAAHEWTLQALARASESRVVRGLGGMLAPHQPVRVAGIDFPGRVGLAAGVDKNGIAARGWAALGFGFAELGTVTAHAQPGNPAPRMFRLRASRAVINRMGFNNAGAQALADRLAGWDVRRGESTLGIPLGISLGKTKLTPLENAVDDYLTSFGLLAPFADYVAVNVSSPNTPGLRSLQASDELVALTRALVGAARQQCPQRPVPVFIKLAPDLTPADLDAALAVAQDEGAAGLIVGNTTLARDDLAAADQPLATEAGGLSGAPLTARALDLVRYVARSQPLPVMGVGGIMTPDDARRMLDAGAPLVQVYTGFIYAGPGLVAGINAL